MSSQSQEKKSLPFAINGLGRIGRALARAAALRPELNLVAVNDLAGAGTLARLLARDSVHGRFPGEVSADGGRLRIAGRPVAVFKEPEPERVPWDEVGARVVVEATGTVSRRELAARHLRGDVRKVVVSSLLPEADITICAGVNEEAYDPEVHQVLSNASCTTHCLALLMRVLDERFGVVRAMMNEVHSFTSNQVLVDGPHPDPRRSRSAAINIVPTSTAAPAAVERLIPSLAGRLAGQAVRVPTPNVALLDVVATLERGASGAELRAAFEDAARGPLDGLLGVSSEPLVSTDFVGDERSAVVDLPLTASLGGELHRVVAWYDNEWGYAHRLADLLILIGETLS